MTADKTFMFQYASNDWIIYEDTGLLTLEEALKYWNDNIESAIDSIRKWDMVDIWIWQNCSSPTDYHEEMPKHFIAGQNLEVIWNHVYRIEKKLLV
mgnify:CR=1 FL=1